MSIKEGDKLPEATLHVMKEGRPTAIKTSELFAGKKIRSRRLPHNVSCQRRS